MAKTPGKPGESTKVLSPPMISLAREGEGFGIHACRVKTLAHNENCLSLTAAPCSCRGQKHLGTDSEITQAPRQPVMWFSYYPKS